MRNVLHVFRHEVYALTSRFSFWFGLFGVPLIGFLLLQGIQWINERESGPGQAGSPVPSVGDFFQQPEQTLPQGYVDLAGLIERMPEDVPADSLIGYANEAEARQALDQQEIGAYYVIPPNYLNSGQLRVIVPEFNLIATDDQAQAISELIAYNLLEGDPQLLNIIRQPITNLEEINQAPEEGLVRDRNSEAAFFVPYAVTMFFMFTILGSAGLLLNSVAKEKENRIIEVLLMSTTPNQLLLGKIIGLGLVGIFQVIVWGVSALTLLRMGRPTLNLPPDFVLQPSLLAWGIIFFLLGYLLYASLMAGIGALVPNLREASQATFIVTLPMLAPLFLLSLLINSPNGPFATAFSIFPFTAPTAMMLRLSAANVPLWQVLLSIALLLVTTVVVIRAVAGMFRAQTLLSGEAFNIKRYFKALVGKI